VAFTDRYSLRLAHARAASMHTAGKVARYALPHISVYPPHVCQYVCQSLCPPQFSLFSPCISMYVSLYAPTVQFILPMYQSVRQSLCPPQFSLFSPCISLYVSLYVPHSSVYSPHVSVYTSVYMSPTVQSIPSMYQPTL
jgi:hypothetical protein